MHKIQGLQTAERYHMLFELGRGGMGIVELAQDTQNGSQLVAIKRMLPEAWRDGRAKTMFLREARLLARIGHPNVVRMLEIDPGDGNTPALLVMEYVEGIALNDIFTASSQGLPIAIAARIAHDIALGLHAAHELHDEQNKPLGLVHRDVSPHNVLVTFRGQVKLLDFGVAKTTEGTRTTTGEIKGKVAYMAPEQALADPVDRRSDIYALGALLYEALSGKRMHGEGTDFEILRRMATGKPVPINVLRPDVPLALAELVETTTAESPNNRPATAEELANALRPFAEGVDEATLAGWLTSCLPDAYSRHQTRLSCAQSMQAQKRTDRPSPLRRWTWSFVGLAIAGAAGAALTYQHSSNPATAASASTASGVSLHFSSDSSPSAVASLAPNPSFLRTPETAPSGSIPHGFLTTPFSSVPRVSTPRFSAHPLAASSSAAHHSEHSSPAATVKIDEHALP